MKVLVIIEKGFEEVEMIAPLGLLRRAGIEVVVSSKGVTKQTSSHNLTICDVVDFNTLENKESYDMLFIPGGSHYKAIESDKDYINLIKYYYDNKLISAICAAPTILGKNGLLKGKSYTCFTSMNEDFEGVYIDTYVVEDGNLLTARSVAASLELGLKMIEKLEGIEKAEEVKKQIYYYK